MGTPPWGHAQMTSAISAKILWFFTPLISICHISWKPLMYFRRQILVYPRPHPNQWNGSYNLGWEFNRLAGGWARTKWTCPFRNDTGTDDTDISNLCVHWEKMPVREWTGHEVYFHWVTKCVIRTRLPPSSPCQFWSDFEVPPSPMSEQTSFVYSPQEPSSEKTKNFIQNNARGFIRPHRKHITGGTLACAETSGVAIAVHSLVYTILSSLLLSSAWEDR